MGRGGSRKRVGVREFEGRGVSQKRSESRTADIVSSVRSASSLLAIPVRERQRKAQAEQW